MSPTKSVLVLLLHSWHSCLGAEELGATSTPLPVRASIYKPHSPKPKAPKSFFTSVMILTTVCCPSAVEALALLVAVLLPVVVVAVVVVVVVVADVVVVVVIVIMAVVVVVVAAVAVATAGAVAVAVV